LFFSDLSEEEANFISTVPEKFNLMCSELGVNKALVTIARVLCSSPPNKDGN
jgi:hypothetical protein